MNFAVFRMEVQQYTSNQICFRATTLNVTPHPPAILQATPKVYTLYCMLELCCISYIMEV